MLLDNKFSTLPSAVAEGRRVINNLERVANLFVTKTVYSMMIAIAVGVAVVPFPFLPRHLTLVGALTIGIPVVLPRARAERPSKQDGVRERVLVFAIPAGITAAAATFTGYALTRIEEGITLEQARTTAAIVLMGVGLVILARLARPLVGWRLTLVLSMLGAFIAVLVIPPLRDFFDLSMPPAIIVFACIGLTSLAAQALTLEEHMRGGAAAGAQHSRAGVGRRAGHDPHHALRVLVVPGRRRIEAAAAASASVSWNAPRREAR